MAPVIVRRVVLVAPVAASVRSSLAVSLRMRPTVMASTPSATRRPTAVAPLRSSAFEVCRFRVSMVNPAAAAVRWAELTRAESSGERVCMNQPALADSSPKCWSACMVSSVSGAEVYVGSLTVWIVGRHASCHASGPWPPTGPGFGFTPFTRHLG